MEKFPIDFNRKFSVSAAGGCTIMFGLEIVLKLFCYANSLMVKSEVFSVFSIDNAGI